MGTHPRRLLSLKYYTLVYRAGAPEIRLFIVFS